MRSANRLDYGERWILTSTEIHLEYLVSHFVGMFTCSRYSRYEQQRNMPPASCGLCVIHSSQRFIYYTELSSLKLLRRPLKLSALQQFSYLAQFPKCTCVVILVTILSPFARLFVIDRLLPWRFCVRAFFLLTALILSQCVFQFMEVDCNSLVS